MSRQPILLAFSCLFVSACSVHPPLPPSLDGMDIPERWRAAPAQDLEEQVDTAWLRSFADPQLERLVAEAMAHNFDLQAAARRVEIAAARARIAGATLQPFVDIEAGAQRQRTNVAPTNGQRNKVFSTAYEASLAVTWEADVWGRIRAGRAAAGEALAATAQDLAFARLSLAARTSQAWFDVITFRHLVRVAEESAEGRRRVAGMVRERFNRGLSPGLALRQILTDLAVNEALAAQRRNALAAARRRLEVLLGRYPATEIKAVEKLPALPPPVPAGLPSQLLGRRPDLLAEAALLKRAGLRVMAAERALLPHFTLTAAGGVRSPELSALIDPASIVWTVAGGLLQPVLNGGRLRNEVELAKGEEAEVLARYKQSLLTAFREVEDALSAEAWLRLQEKQIAEAVRQAEASAILAQSRYRSGLIKIITLLDTLRNRLNARSRHLEIQRALLVNRVNLHLALGGGFGQPLPKDNK